MSGWFEKLLLGGAVLLIAPAIIAGGGFGIAIAAALLWIGGLLGIREGVDIYKKQNVGARASMSQRDVTNRLTSANDDEDRWGRN